MHTARMEVHEAGTTASAATYAMPDYPDYEHTFTADRPFIFNLYDKELKQVLFTGVYVNPV